MSSNKRILLIDDDSTTSALNKMIIERAELVDEVLIFTSAVSALDYLNKKHENKHVDLILLDLNMPIMDGWEFIRAYEGIKISTPSPIVILSSSIDPVDISRAESEPAISEFKSKPLSIEMIRQLVSKYLTLST